MRRQVGGEAERIRLALQAAEAFQHPHAAVRIEPGGAHQAPAQLVRLVLLLARVGVLEPPDADPPQPGRHGAARGRGHRDGRQRLPAPLQLDAVDRVAADDVGHLVPDHERQLVAAAADPFDQGRRHEDVAAGQREGGRVVAGHRGHLEAVHRVAHAGGERRRQLVEQRLHGRVDRPGRLRADRRRHLPAEPLPGADGVVLGAGDRIPHPLRLAELPARQPAEKIGGAARHKGSLAPPGPVSVRSRPGRAAGRRPAGSGSDRGTSRRRPRTGLPPRP